MKNKNKHILASVTAIGLACTLTAGALLHSSVSVAASAAMMPGIETIVKNNTTKNDIFRILEIVDDTNEAEIGYYVSGQEPYLKLYRYDTGEKDQNGAPVFRTFKTVEEGLSVIKNAEERKSFVQNSPRTDGVSTNIKDVRAICGDGIEEAPLAYQAYEERYFLSDSEAQDSTWKRIDFEDTEPRTEELHGHYEKVNPGEGDYKKEEVAYYPVRRDIDTDREKAKFIENITGFAYTGEGMQSYPYQINFMPVLDGGNNPITKFNPDSIKADYDYKNGKYGYYENVYRELTDNVNPQDFPGEKKPIEELFLAAEEVDMESAFLAPDEFGDGSFEDGIVEFEEFEDPFVDGFSDEFEVEAAAEPEPVPVGEDDNPVIYRAQLIKDFPNYKYIPYKTLNQVKNEAVEYPTDDNAEFKVTPGMITHEPDGTYKLWTQDELVSDHLNWEYLYYVQGRYQVSVENVRNLPDDYYTAFDMANNELKVQPYYYRISQTKFACEFDNTQGIDINDAEKHPDVYRYTGWYYAFKPENEDAYIEAGDKEATHYTSKAEYTLVPGKGDWKFVYDENEENTELVQLDHLYYKGGYINHDWFKRFVLHLSPEDTDSEVQQQFADFDIQVDTLTSREFEEKYGDAIASDVPEAAAFSDNPAEFGESGEDIFVSEEEVQQLEFTGGEASSEFTEAEFLDSDTESSDGVLVEVEPLISEGSESLVSFEAFEDGIDAEFESYDDEVIEIETPSDEDIIFEEENSVPEEVLEIDEAEDSPFGDGEEILFSDEAQVEAAFKADNNELPLPEFVSEYDLIYVNGILDLETAKGLSEQKVPCIINQNKLGDVNLQNGFYAFIDNDDTDGHYVSQYVYVFKNIPAGEHETEDSLVNRRFPTPFYSEDKDGVISGQENLDGFEEILEYIESENQYRALSGEDDFSDGTEGVKYEALSKSISQARVVEYILNYKYKRTKKLKDEIHVLEIQPANAKGTLDEADVSSWLYGADAPEFKVPERDSCCCNYGSEPVANIVDGNPNTIWHNNWAVGNANRHKEPWFMVEIAGNPANICGVRYLPRQDSANGRAEKYRIEIYDVNKNPIDGLSVQGDFGSPGSKEIHEVKFEKALPVTAKYIKFIFLEQNPKDILATCAEFSIMHNINIDTMTSSEYVGHVDDINAKYDIIYFGDDSSSDYYSPHRNGGSGRLYAHMGEPQKQDFYTAFMGLLDIDYSPDKTQLLDPKASGVSDKVGWLRGSGNDITPQQVRELMSFVSSGYPVVIADGLIKDGGVNTDVVDSTSWIYRFFNDCINKANVFTEEDIISGGELSFFANLAKPEIVFENAECLPPEPPRLNDSSYHYNKEARVGYLLANEEGMRFEFTVKNDSEVSSVNAVYDCKLFLDLNFDGNLSENEEQYDYIEIVDKESGKVLTTVNDAYQLQIGNTYVLTRKIPNDYFKIIAWKLEISSNNNPNIRTSRMGFTKRIVEERQEINVLQIKPNVEAKNNGDMEANTWDLAYNPELTYPVNSFQDMLSKVADFKITITSMTVNEYQKKYAENIKGNNLKNILDDYQMLILGFADVYPDIKNTPKDTDPNFEGNGAVEAILQFVKDGKSVIFSHDTTSFINRDTQKVSNKLYPTDRTVEASGTLWGYSMNTYLRSIVGMDRYGIMSQERISGDKTLSDVLKVGNNLTSGDMVLWDAVKNISGDMAYEFNNSNMTSFMTQGYSNNNITKRGNYSSGVVSKVNEGAITQYPYYIGDKIEVVNTHSQYFQLAMERDDNNDKTNDIVVWYCLAPGDEVYKLSPNDVRNNYYFYSKGNVIYTGVGHSIVEDASINNLQEKQLFVNAIVAAAEVTAVDPEVKFLEDFSPNAEEEFYKYYSRDFSFKNDPDDSAVRNVLENEMDFNLRIKNYNMAAADFTDGTDKTSMTLELFIDNPDSNETIKINDSVIHVSKLSGPRDISTVPLVSEMTSYLTGESYYTDDKGVFHISRSDTFAFSVSDIEYYLRRNAGYLNNCRIYARVTSTVPLYGKPVTREAWSVITLKERLLFDMD